MAGKFQRITDLYQQAVREVAESPENWVSFLESASRNYRLPFDEQLLVHVQRPDATAVLQIEHWNRRFGRWVRKGSKGIAVLDKSAGQMALKYYFDISDTQEGRNLSIVRPVPLWEVREEYREEVQEALANAFSAGVGGSLERTIFHASRNIAEENMPDYLEDMLAVRENSMLEELDEMNVRLKVRTVLENSVALMLLSRCGCDVQGYLSGEDFADIVDFDTPELTTLLGSAVSDIGQIPLMEIADTVSKQLRYEKKRYRTFAFGGGGEYSVGIGERKEGNEDGRNRIQQPRGLSSSQPDGAGGAASRWEVRITAQEVSEGEPLRKISEPVHAGETEPTLAADTAGRYGKDGDARQPDEAGAGRDGGTQGGGPDGVGRQDEQHPAGGGRNRAEGTDLQLGEEAGTEAGEEIADKEEKTEKSDRDSLPDFSASVNPFVKLPSENEQLSLFDIGFDWQKESTGQGMTADKASPFALPQQIIDEALCLGGNEPGSVGRICANYMHGHVPEKNIAFLKKEFGEDGKGFVSSRGKVSVWHREDGIHIAYGETALRAGNSTVVSWEQADRRIVELLQMGRYATQEVLEGALPAERQELAGTLWHLHHDTSEGTELLEELFHGGFPEDTRRIAEMMADVERLGHIIESVEQFALAYEEDSGILRFHYYQPEELLQRLRALQQEPLDFQAQGDFSRLELFISQDEVDALFTKRGSGMRHGKYRIYQHFLEEHSEAEQIAFLKAEYGTGGAGWTGYNESHDAKGIVFSRGDMIKPYDKVTISWKQAAKRIKKMIRESRYLSEKEIAAIPAYEKSELAGRIWGFFYNQPEEVARPYPYGAGYDDAERAVLPQLERPERIDSILETMAQVLDNTAEFDSHYASMQRAYRDMQAFREGAYTLFPSLPERDARILAESRAGRVEERDRDEIEVLADILYDMKMEDISLDYEDGVLTAGDEDGNEWRGEEFYHFLVDEAMVFEEDGTCQVLSGEQLDDFWSLAERYGILPDAPALPAEKQNVLEPSAGDEDAEEPQAGKGESPSVPEHGEKGESPSVPEHGEEEEIQADLTPAWERRLPRAGLEELHPEIPPAERNQYRIANDALGHGSPKEKFRANLAAIQMLKKCEAEGRLSTPEEQEVLAKYVGWGGLPDAFDETKTAWGTEYLELKTVLTPEEYDAARESTLTAFYTPPVVIRAMYRALENMGLKSGNILEPSCGAGNFIGMKPESLSDCKIYGVEMDSVSARIAGQLYQNSRIAASGYEDVAMPDSFFDVAVGNVPFGQFQVSDKRYRKFNFLIHDYFFAKTLDKVRPGGIIAFITSYGTMDKKNSAVRKYIAERADLLGAVRLPNDTFQKNAGTKVTSDILFLQKRESLAAGEPDWLFLDRDENGIPMNRYFATHPEMILGEMAMESSRFGMDSTCRPREGVSLESQLAEAIRHIRAEITDYEAEELVEEDGQTIPANPEAANFSYALVEGRIYYRENSRMKPVKLSITGQNRVRGMIAIRDCVRKLIEYQTEDYPDADIRREQENLNRLYDSFQKKYGLLNSRGNSMVFSEDNSYPLLCSLEVIREDGTLERKADMFHKRTIKPKVPVHRVDTAQEALAVALAERAEVDMGRMEELCGRSREEIEQELAGLIFRLPDGENPAFVTADEYLSGNVREKLKAARAACESSEAYRINVEALEKVQPEDLSAMEIKVRLGTTWIPAGDFQDFVYELLEPPGYCRRHIRVHYSEITSQWSIEGKNRDRGNVKAGSTYGTERANAYRIIEDSLNLRDTRIYDYVEDEEGKKKAVLNKKETAVAQGKQEAIRLAFEEWIWKDPERRERLTAYYNEHFNAIRPREYDGSHLTFPGMNPEISLRTHQTNAIARTIYGGNTLLAHVVGAGKTYTMVAAAMKMKQMGLCHKSMIVVPNHIIEQFSAEWLQLYPSANILVATKKSFEKKNRRKFCARIATGEYDAVIIGHSQFERIPMSVERQAMVLEQQKREIMAGIDEAKRMEGARFTVKQLERTKKNLDTKLEKLNNQDRKDDVITFEQLGVDRLFVDEADNYKNRAKRCRTRTV